MAAALCPTAEREKENMCHKQDEASSDILEASSDVVVWGRVSKALSVAAIWIKGPVLDSCHVCSYCLVAGFGLYWHLNRRTKDLGKNNFYVTDIDMKESFETDLFFY